MKNYVKAFNELQPPAFGEVFGSAFFPRVQSAAGEHEVIAVISVIMATQTCSISKSFQSNDWVIRCIDTPQIEIII